MATLNDVGIRGVGIGILHPKREVNQLDNKELLTYYNSLMFMVVEQENKVYDLDFYYRQFDKCEKELIRREIPLL